MAFTEIDRNGVVYMASRQISAVHAFTTRYGGVSEGIYASMNLRSNLGDDIACVAENYDRLYKALGIPEGRLVLSRQVHGSLVRPVTEKDCVSPLEEIPVHADGMITDTLDVALMVYTADCIPILLHDGVRNVIGAVHAGWRSTALGIAGEAVRKMIELYGCKPENIHAAIGPGIGRQCFETDRNVPEAMLGLGIAGIPECIDGDGPKYHVDLKGINACVMENAGVLRENIDISPECTMCLHEKYWSHRYTGGHRGSQASVIILKGNHEK